MYIYIYIHIYIYIYIYTKFWRLGEPLPQRWQLADAPGVYACLAWRVQWTQPIHQSLRSKALKHISQRCSMAQTLSAWSSATCSLVVKVDRPRALELIWELSNLNQLNSIRK